MICTNGLKRALLMEAIAVAGAMACAGTAGAMPPGELAASYSARAGTPADPARGERFFVASHGREWRCATCHGALPTGDGRHAATGRAIGPLAPAFRAGRLSEPAKVEKWFKRNCNDVLGRECTAGEKADVLAWLISLKP
jgi:mono/diheme cytochrome c family protein